MDIFVEQLIKRKSRPQDIALKAACIAGIVFFIWLLFNLLFAFPSVASITLLLFAGAMYAIYYIYTSVNVEFEYCFTNGAFDVDKIVAAKRRKRVTELNARSIEILATKNNSAFRGYMENAEIKKIYACTSTEDEGVYFVVYEGLGGRYMLLFNPSDKILDGFRRLNPKRVFLTD